MRFSIAIPAYKPQYLLEAVQSVIAQTYSDWELIIVDDCSPHDLRGLLSSCLDDPRVRYYRNLNNIGAFNLVDNWNKCLKYCTGDYIICMGDDDRMCPDCLYLLDGLISKKPFYGVYHGRVEIINQDGEIVDILEERPDTESSLEMIRRRWEGRRQFIGDFCFNRSYLLSSGGFFKLPLAWGADDISVYVAAKGTGFGGKYDGIANLNEPVFQYRVNNYSISSSSEYKVKLLSMKRYTEWFRHEFNSLLELDESSFIINEIKKLNEDRYLECARYYIRMDVKTSPGSIWFWLKHRKEYQIPFNLVLLQTIKGILR